MLDLSGARVSFRMDLKDNPDVVEPLQQVLQALNSNPLVNVGWVAPDTSTVLTSSSLLLSLVFQGVGVEVVSQEHELWRDLLYALESKPWCLDCLGRIRTSEILGHDNDHRRLWVERSEVLRLGVPSRVQLYTVRPRREPYYRSFLSHVHSGRV